MNPLSRLVDLSSAFVAYALLLGACLYFGTLPFSFSLPFDIIKASAFPWPHWLLYSILGAATGGVLVVIFNPFRMPRAEYGGAHWAKENEIKKFGLRGDSGLILGINNGKFLRMDEPLSVLCFAPPGTGKTSGLVVPSLLACAHSVVVHDPKGELYDLTSKHRGAFSRVVRFAPAESDSAGWNPLAKNELPEEWADKETIISRIAATLFPVESGGQEYFARGAQSIFNFWAMFLVHKNGETSLPEILKMALCEENAQAHIADVLTEENPSKKNKKGGNEKPEPEDEPDLELNPNPGKKPFPMRIDLEGNSLLQKAYKEFSGCQGTFKEGMSIFLDSRVNANTAKSEFCIKSLRAERTSVYLCVTVSDQTRLKPLLTLFFEAVCLAFQDKAPEPGEQNITLFLDEFPKLGKLNEARKLPEVGRGCGINALFIAQSFEQLRENFGEAGAQALKGTTSFHLLFTQNDERQAAEYSRAIGSHTRKRRTRSGLGHGLGRESHSESFEGVPLVKSQEILSLPQGELLILVQGSFQTPIRAKAASWFKDSKMKRAVNA